MSESEPDTEIRVVQAPTYCVITEVQLKDGKPSSYTEDSLIEAPTLEALTKLIHDAMAALGKPTLSEADNFPDQERIDMLAALGTFRKIRRQGNADD